MIKISFLGTNGWYDTDTGNTICVLIETGNEYIVLDAGDGIYKLDRYIKARKPIYVFISHFHLDHLSGLHVLAKFRFKQGMNICIRKGRMKQFKRLMGRPFTIPLPELKMKTRALEVSRRDRRFPFLADYLPLYHSDISMGMRFDLEGKIVTYLPDTGVCRNAYALARNADLLIAECAMRTGAGSKDWPHLNPRTAARIAKRAAAKRLALVHFDAAVYRSLNDRIEAGRAARRIFKQTTTTTDGQVINL